MSTKRGQFQRTECLDHLLILGESHLRTVLKIYEEHYDGFRPHQGIAQEIPAVKPLTPRLTIIPQDAGDRSSRYCSRRIRRRDRPCGLILECDWT